MYKFILDCNLMRYPDSGLYYYCLNLGNYIQKALSDSNDKMKFYVPASAKEAFAKKENCIVEKKYHKFFKPFLQNCTVWHAPFQSGRIVPDKRKHPNIKILLTIHDLNALHEGKPIEEQIKSVAHTQSLIDKSDAVVCISEFCKNDVLLHCNVKNKPLYVIHNGKHNVEEPALLSSSYRPLAPFLFGMGYVNKKKNYHVLLSLVKNTDMELVVAGKLDEDDYVGEMKKEAERMGISDKIHLTGPVSEGEKAWYLSNCEAFVHPSLAEGFGAPVVEAMAFGKPLFLSDKTSLPEIGGDIAFYFRNFEEDHMQQVLKEGLAEYRKNGLMKKIMSRAQQFDWEKNARQYLDVYRSLCE